MSQTVVKRKPAANKRMKRQSKKINRTSANTRRRASRKGKKLLRSNRINKRARGWKRGILARKVPAAPIAPTAPASSLVEQPSDGGAAPILIPLTGIIFSKDRALQLDAALRSLYLHALDISNFHMKVLYKTSSDFYESQYERLKNEYPLVQFIKEEQFKEQVIASMEPYTYVLFIVDDCLFVRDFTLQSVMNTLAAHNDLIGFSLRLGPNIRYCYTMSAEQSIPWHHIIEYGYRKFDWTSAQYEFGYPIEVSSSVYRTTHLLPHLRNLDFSNPNTLEGCMAGRAQELSEGRQFLACSEVSLAFCNPLNVVQNVYANRAGSNKEYSPQELALLFENGDRINVNKYANYIPAACHEQVDIF